MAKLFGGIYEGKRVFITGHTGFKGSWLALWLQRMGAIVNGYSLESTTHPNHFELLDLSIKSTLGDIRDKAKLMAEMDQFQPDIVFHLAAQPLVLYSYAEPSETYETNVMGTLNVLEACRSAKSVKAIVCVTTDKVYENREAKEGYSEEERLGGYDPYSASKACAEILISSYVNSFLHLKEYGISHLTLVATARGGNVIGGGDWCDDRLIPDLIRAIQAKDEIEIRSPQSVRPWQHVLDCLSGYLILGEKLLSGRTEIAGSWNFGPAQNELISVKEIVTIAQDYWSDLGVKYGENLLHETAILQLNCEKAQTQLAWKPLLENAEMFKMTFEWYREYYATDKVLSIAQIDSYIAKGTAQNASWIS